MRRLALVPVLVLSLCSSLTAAVAQRQPDPWRGARPETRTERLDRPMDALQVQSTIDKLNEDSKETYGHTFVVKYYFELGPLNRIQVNSDLWNSLTAAQRKQMGAKFARVFKGTGLLFAEFFVEDARVGKVRADPISGGLKFEMEE